MRRHEAETGRTGDHHYVVTCTTRAPRAGEVDGVDYHFLDRDEFLRTLRAPAGSSRRTRSTATGTARRATRSARRWPPASDVILKIDVQGAQVVKEQVPRRC